MNEVNGAATEMPKYVSHKKVWALKIKSVLQDNEYASNGEISEILGAELEVEEPGYAPVRVDRDYLYKHQPKAGGYYVVYEDGYKSFSPAKAFEEGYDKL